MQEAIEPIGTDQSDDWHRAHVNEASGFRNSDEDIFIRESTN